jgi:D-alanyl-lipoteichoic acid acyltransferase DltB (MBOAT superfamily)
MLFNSYEFVLFFLPLTLLGFFVLARIRGAEAALAWLTLASLFFYAWWNPKYVLLLLASTVGNFLMGRQISGARSRGDLAGARLLTGLGVTASLVLLAYFKYAAFVVGNWNLATGSDLPVPAVVLPLAISFYTFQQIAYLVDAYRGRTAEYKPIHYALFVTFFPQLIAGPIVHHRDVLPQFMSRDAIRPRLENLAVGTGIFAIGLFKKVVLADGIAQFATPVFDAAQGGDEPTLLVAWGGALAYTMQLYFDFSGYSDMAIGGARLFGIRLPLNFNSPYKATNISEFWRRWHMTLSQFLRDYVYIPLGGNRLGSTRRYVNLMTTMLLGGLWHGAGWTFVAWGGLHGLYLVCHQVWAGLRRHAAEEAGRRRAWSNAISWGLTFFAVVVGWVFFRAESFGAAWRILQGMAGLNGVALPNALAARFGESWAIAERLGVTTFLGGGSAFVANYAWLLVLLPAALWMPNTQEIFRDFEPALAHKPGAAPEASQLLVSRSARRRIVWRPTPRWAAVTAAITCLGLLSLSRVSEFLYFQF